jgi:outer membrane protein assembly factor BamD
MTDLAMFPRLLVMALVTALGAAGVACGGSVRDSDDNTEYSVSARQNYDKGISKLEDEEWSEAAKFFAFVKARFPYSKYAVLAELRMADALFGAGSYLEAIDGYKLFIKFHPTHEMVSSGYAPFRIGEAYFKMLPDDWFLVPPSYEKDPSATLDAARELASFLKKYPKSTHVKKAREMYTRAAKLLADHEWYVARFYWSRDKPMGTVLRLRGLLEHYPGVGYDEEALYLLGKAYLAVGRPKDARTTFERLVSRYPRHRRATQARDEISKLGAY